ncbi:MAG: hypothetical protein RL307_281 [Pseudomonadota bacterium]|jgi:uncharacterized FAD-dependent dehydrogenase
MIRISELKFPLDARFDPPPGSLEPPVVVDAVWQQAAKVLGVPLSALQQRTVFKRSFDARKKPLHVVYIVDVGLGSAQAEQECLQKLSGNPHVQATPDMAWYPPITAEHAQNLRSREWGRGERPVVVGFGPCGIFAALALAEMGLRPIVVERGKTVRERTQDTWALWRKRQLQPNSNVQFGEGGAGTFSDGKLYSQIKDPRFLGRKLMQDMVAAGAPEDILFAAHPHIGTFKLVKVVQGLRERIESLGGEIRFEQALSDIFVDTLPHGERQIKGIELKDMNTGERTQLDTQQVLLAVGHSARDVFALLWRLGVPMAAKPFSIGVRIEHPQSVIDKARWGPHAGHPMLGAADYKLVHHASNGRSVYSFCMCPGGTVVAATSETGHVVTNGMSQYSRNERNANAGLVVGIEPSDFPTDPDVLAAHLPELPREQWVHGPPLALGGVVLQRQLEQLAFQVGGGNYSAPGQRVQDFLEQRPSLEVGSVTPSYKPGVTPCDLAEVLPEYAMAALREALPAFGQKIRGYDAPDTWMTGVETRTSSPIRLHRDDQGQSPGWRGLFVAGEGAGFAGGILSAGVDGIKSAEHMARYWLSLNSPAS